MQRKKNNVIRCGRRFGKTMLIENLITEYIRGQKPIAYICLDYSKNLIPVWNDMAELLNPLIARKDIQSSTMVLTNGAVVDFWSVEGLESMRGRKYYQIFWDEAAADRKLEEHNEYIVKPCLIDYDGGIDYYSTPKGYNYFKVLDEKSLTNPNWKSFHYTSYDGVHERAVIDELIKDTPSIVAQQEYFAEYVDMAGALVKREWIKTANEVQNNLDIVMAVDLAISEKTQADYTAVAVLGKDGNGNIFVLDIYRGRITFRETKNIIKEMAKKWNARIIGIEEVGYQSALIQELLRETDLNIKGIKPTKDKITRFMPIASRYEQGIVYHKVGLMAEFEQELLSFPESEHDDMIDALGHAYSLFTEGGLRFIAV